MEDLSLHILDVVEKSITAGAREVEILIDENNAENRLSLEIADDGSGMDEELRRKVLDPFFTTRKTRRVGLGLPLLAQAASQSGGSLEVDSAPGQGTRVRVCFQLSHPDLKPLGDVGSTLGAILAGRPELGLRFVYRRDGEIVASLDSTLPEANRSE
jgi:hypothetical protein